MKPIKKKPRKQLEKFSTIFTQIGLVLALFVVYAFMELETEEKKLSVDKNYTSKVVVLEPDEDFIFTKETPKEPKVDEKKPTKFYENEKVKTADNTIDDTPFLKEPNIEKPVFHLDSVVEFKEEPKIIEDVSYEFVQNTPVFKGCEGLSEKENKICFDEKMKKHVQRNFDGNLAERLGLRSGKYRIQTQFIIDDKGNVVDIQIRAPHQKLEKETLDLIEKLPKFTPGKQQNRNVKVRFTLPITFYID